MKVLYFPPFSEICGCCCSKDQFLNMIAYRNLCIQAGVLLKLAVKHKAINIHRNVLDLILEYVFWQKPMKLYYKSHKYHRHTACLIRFAEFETHIFPTFVPAYFIEATVNTDDNVDLAGYPIFRGLDDLKVVGRLISRKRGVCWVPGISVKFVEVLLKNGDIIGVIITK